MIPEGWSVQKFGDVTRIAEGQVDPRVEPFRTMRHIGPENVERDTGQLSDCLTCEEIDLISGKYAFDERAIVYSKIRPNLNKVCFPRWAGVCSADMYPIWPVEENLIAEFLYHTMLGPIFVKRAVACSMRTGMPKINRADLTSLPIELPPLHEQRRIAEILSTWDRAIETVDALIANARTQKKALMQSLLTGKKRLPGFSEEWTTLRLGDALSERSERGGDDLPLLSVTQSKGVIYQDQAGRKNISSADQSNYKTVKSGDIAYNTMRMWQGASALSGLHGKVSPAYTIVTPRNGHDANYYAYLFKWPAMIHVFERHSQGLVSDTWNLKYPHFAKIPVRVPPYKEQVAIRQVLMVADEGLRACKDQLAALREEKCALMQQLLTGKRRVKAKEKVEA